MTEDRSQTTARLQPRRARRAERFAKACSQARQYSHALVVVYGQLAAHFHAEETPRILVSAKAVGHAIWH